MKSRNTGGILTGFLVGFAIALVLVAIAYFATSGNKSTMNEETMAQVEERIEPEGHVVMNTGNAAAPAAQAGAQGGSAPAATTATPAAAATAPAAATGAPAAAATAPAAGAGGGDMQALAQSKGCLGCHGIDNKIVGPAYKDVAAKYAGDAGAAEMLAAKVKNGGSGTWGEVPMPPNSAVSDEDIKKLVNWVLSL